MRAILNRLLVYLVIAAAIVLVAFSHVDLWITRGGEAGAPITWNTRVVIPALTLLGLVAILVAINAVAIARFLGSRRALVALNVTIMVLVAGTIVVFVNVINARQYKRLDVTTRGTYSITERTAHILEGLPANVAAHVFVPPENPWYGTVRGMLDTFVAAANRRLEVEYLNPGRDRDRLERTLQALGVNPKEFTDPDVIIFEVKDPETKTPRTKHVTVNDIVELDYSAGFRYGGPRLKGFKGEEQFLKAILDVTRRKQTAIYFLRGHQEFETYGRRPDERIQEFEKTLKALNYKVETFEFDFAPDSGKDVLPADCDVLAIVGPRTALADREVERIREFLERGGRLLLLADPELRQRPGTRSVFFDDLRLNALLKGYGLSFESAYVFDSATITPFGLFTFQAKFEGVSATHPVTKPLVGLGLLFNVAQPILVEKDVEDAGEKAAKNKANPQSILETLASAVAVTDMDAVNRTGNPLVGSPRKGPLIVAAVSSKVFELASPTATAGPAGPAESREGEGAGAPGAAHTVEARILVVGDAHIASDDLASGVVGNMDFLVNAVGWLAAREESISIAAKAPEILRLRLDADQVRRLWLMSLVELPLACAFIGLIVWRVRRRTR